MSHAADLLASTDIAINEVARRVGYHEPSQFTKAFRRVHGRTPSEFRAASRRSP
jgi:AraC-like DNA-binding protein